MKSKLLKCFTAVLVGSMLLAGCGKSSKEGATNQTSSNKAENKKEVGQGDEGKYQTTYGDKMFDNVTITVELFDRSNAPEGSTITSNRWTEYAQEQMKKVGINLEFVPVSRWDEVSKMQAMMASGTAPDITITYTYSQAEQYYKDGGIWNLSEFIDGEKQAKNLKAYVGENVLNIGRNESQELYGIVAKRATTAKSNLFIRQDWLDKLNLQIPTTIDEFYNVLVAFKNSPDATNATVPAYFWNRWNMKMAFSQLDGNEKEFAVALGDEAFGDYYDAGNREYYRFMNKLYNEGLLHKEYYTLSEDNVKSLLVTGTLGFYEGAVNYVVDSLRGSLLKTLQENVPGANLVAIEPFKNVNNGKQYSAAYAEGGLIAFCPLTASAEKVEACMTYLDWMATEEGGFVFHHGFEDEHYTLDDNNVPVVKDSAYNGSTKDWIRTDIFLVGNQGYFKTVDDFNACVALESPGYEQHVIDNYKKALTGTIINDPTYTSSSTPDYITDITIIKDEYTTSVVTCSVEEFDATYDSYMQELEQAGIKTIIEERQAYFSELYGN